MSVDAVTALGLSIRVALAATLLNALIGIPLAYVLGDVLTEVNGVAKPHSSTPGWPRASGDVMNETGPGHYTIERPGTPGEKIEIDFSDKKEPKRVLPP